jgi:cobalt-precorrin 5A hydrolase / precorrin-3B C17-methyltransferase
MSGPIIIVLSAGGLHLARRLAGNLDQAVVHGLAGRVDDADETFTDTLAHLRQAFKDGRPIIGICAAGILIRALAPVIKDKCAEPPVLAVAEDGSTVVPLLGGHNGANQLAGELADALGVSAAITTASDVKLGMALDDPPPGWKVGNRAAAKPVAAALLAGEPVSLSVECGDATWLMHSDVTFSDDAGTGITVTHKDDSGDSERLVLHPPVMALGVGCERDCAPDELIELAQATLAEAGLSPKAVACVVSIDLKADEAAVHAVAAHLGVPARFFQAGELEAQTPRLANPSDVVFAEVGCHGVAEGAALASVGSDGELIVPKHKSKRATCAIAMASGEIDVNKIGSARGRLTVVGIGPGADGWRTPAVTRALAEADEVVGYGLYLDLIAGVIGNKPRHDSRLSEEEARVRIALERAAEGLDVALVCSGDAGIYALATLVFELLDRENKPEWNRLDIRVEPGVSAIQAAASRLGAPIGHDFCTVSLSDLLTPWEVIENRLQAAASGDFIVALYNPVSKRRRHQLIAARDAMLAHRPGETPVILGRNLGREEESLEVIRLDELEPDRVDMLTLVLIGNRQTRFIKRGQRQWVYTPRGYASKMAPG